jgi:hypothetical protein
MYKIVLHGTLWFVVGFSVAYALSEWACPKGVNIQAAREAYYQRIAEGPKRDRLLAAVDRLNRENAIIREQLENRHKE